MTIDAADFAGFVLLAVPLSLLGYGLFLLRRAGQTGGLHAGLSRLVLDGRRVRRFLRYLSAVIVAFLIVGATGAIGLFDPSAGEALGAIQAAAFLGGCLALLLLMVNPLEPRPLGLAEETRLEEDSPNLLMVIRASEHVPARRYPESMYLLPPVEVAGNRAAWDTYTEPTRPREGPSGERSAPIRSPGTAPGRPGSRGHAPWASYAQPVITALGLGVRGVPPVDDRPEAAILG